MCVRKILALEMVKVGTKCALNGAQFVDESAIEIDVADDEEDVCQEKEKRIDCAKILGTLSHQRGDKMVNDELTTQRDLQFGATFSDHMVENELNRYHMTLQPCLHIETCPDLSFHKQQREGNVQKALSGCETAEDHFVDESAVVIDIAEDEDSCDSVVVITDDSDADENTARSTDILNGPKNATGSQNGLVSDLSGNVSFKQTGSLLTDSRQACPPLTYSRQSCQRLTNSRQSSPDIAAISLDKMSPAVSQPPGVRRSRRTKAPEFCEEDLLLEYNLQHLKAVSGPDAVGDSPTVMFDEFDLEHLQKPFHFGWRRELVCRRVSGKTHRRVCDVYYRSPEGKKLRSMVEISSHLNSVTNSPVNLTHFTLKQVLIFNPPMESVRLAASCGRRKLVGQKNSPVRLTAEEDVASRHGADPTFRHSTDTASRHNTDSTSIHDMDTATRLSVNMASRHYTDMASRHYTDIAFRHDTDTTSRHDVSMASRHATDMASRHATDMASRHAMNIDSRHDMDMTCMYDMDRASRPDTGVFIDTTMEMLSIDLPSATVASHTPNPRPDGVMQEMERITQNTVLLKEEFRLRNLSRRPEKEQLEIEIDLAESRSCELTGEEPEKWKKRKIQNRSAAKKSCEKRKMKTSNAQR